MNKEEQLDQRYTQLLCALNTHNTEQIYTLLHSGCSVFNDMYRYQRHESFTPEQKNELAEKFNLWLDSDIEHIYDAYTLLDNPPSVVRHKFWTNQSIENVKKYKENFPKKFESDTSFISEILRLCSENNNNVYDFLINETHFLSSIKKIYESEFYRPDMFYDLLFLKNESFPHIAKDIFISIKPDSLQAHIMTSINYMLEDGFVLAKNEDVRYKNLEYLIKIIAEKSYDDSFNNTNIINKNNNLFNHNHSVMTEHVTVAETLRKMFIVKAAESLTIYAFSSRIEEIEQLVNFFRDAADIYLKDNYNNEKKLRSYNFPSEILDSLLPYYKISQAVSDKTSDNLSTTNKAIKNKSKI